jgi:hypothetical protein
MNNFLYSFKNIRANLNRVICVPYHDRKINLNNILLDIETVPESENYDALDPEMQALWEHKTLYQRKDDLLLKNFTTVLEFGLSLVKLCVFR